MKKRIVTFALAFVMLLGAVPAVEADAAGYASGQEIVELAMNYIGAVPYVWGGTTIDGANPGADCSGFICRLYEKFGFNFWANRTKLRNCGTNLGADLSLAQLGDIIWYDGHVAIFAGYRNGYPMIVHCTGGNYRNVVYSRADKVGAQLKGVIRIPGVVNNGETVSSAYFSPASQSEYADKYFIGETNALLVSQVNKLSGVRVTEMGIYIYDENGNLITRYAEDVSNIVGSSTTLFHSWYDINAEVGITLSKATTYQYCFFGVFDGEEIVGDLYAFTTAGIPDVQSFDAYFHSGLDHSFYDVVTVTKGECIGAVPEPYIPEGYLFKGWYTAASGGYEIGSNTLFDGSADVSFYAQYEAVEKNYTAYFYSGENFEYCDSVTMTYNQQMGALPEAYVPGGYNFLGWYTAPEGGGKVGSTTLYNVEQDYSFYARYEIMEKFEPDFHRIILWVNKPIMSVDGEMVPIDGQGTAPAIINSRTMLPIRALMEAMGGSVEWDNTSKTISLSKDGETLKLRIGANYAWDSEDIYPLDSAPVIVNGRTLLPVRTVVEYFHGWIEWDGSAKSVTINFEE